MCSACRVPGGREARRLRRGLGGRVLAAAVTARGRKPAGAAAHPCRLTARASFQSRPRLSQDVLQDPTLNKGERRRRTCHASAPQLP